MVGKLKEYGLKLGIENHPEKNPGELLAKIGDGGEGTIGAAVDTGWFGTHSYDAAKALEFGLVAEVLPPDRLMARAHELAAGLAKRPTLLLRYTRLLLTEYLRRQMHDLLGYGLGMEMLALLEKPEGP